MKTISITDAISNLYNLIDDASSSHEPIFITCKRASAVLISKEDWLAIQETLSLLSVPGVRDSIQSGLDMSIDECSEELDW